MGIIINSLYSNKDIFLREFISNASNALDKIRFLSLTDKEILGEGDDAKLEIQLSLRKCSYVWESKADGAFAVSKDPWNEPLGRGTEIRLHLREEAGKYLEESKLKDHQRWLPVAELALPEEKGRSNLCSCLGTKYWQVITTGTYKQIAIWHLRLNPNLNGKLSTEKVWEMKWNISGMTLATTGGDGVVSLW